MSIRTHYITGDLPYYALVCDTCAHTYISYDDSCYLPDALTRAAHGDGWTTSPTSSGHHCPRCSVGASPDTNAPRHLGPV
jgi:hypothetical protein